MVKARFALAKYLTCFPGLIHLGRDCFANLTHMLQTSSFNETHVLVASNRISLVCLEGRTYNYLIKYLPVLIILLNSLPVLVASVKDTPGETLVHTFVHNKYFPARWVSRKLSPKS